MMAGIKGKNTKPELVIRRGLHALGFRYRLHDSRLPGRPDMVLPRHRAVIMVHGCFWHGHHCSLFRWPKSREVFWRDKLNGNRQRDAITDWQIVQEGWRLLKIWECSLKGRGRLGADVVIKRAAEWLRSGLASDEITEVHHANC